MVDFRKGLLPRFLILISLCLIICGCRSSREPGETAPRAAGGVLDLKDWDFRERGQLPLEGEWRFLWNELRSPGKMADTEDGYFVSVPDKWHNYRLDGERLEHRGYGTFSLSVILPEGQEDCGLYFDGAGSAYSLWINRELLIQSGRVGTGKDEMVPEKKPRTLLFHSPGETLELVIQISNYHHQKGGFRNSLWIGDPEQIYGTQRKVWVQESVTLGILFIMGLKNLIVYLFRKRFRSALYFSILCFTFFLRLGFTNEDLLLMAFPFLSWTFAFYIDYLSLFFTPLLVALFYRSLYPREISRALIRILTFASVSFSLFALFAGTYIASYSIKYYQVLILLEILYYISFLFRINLRKREGALVVTIASATLFVSSGIEIFSLWDWLGTEKIGVYGFLSFFFVQSVILSRGYSRAFVRVESLTGELKSTNRNLLQSETRYRNFFENSIDILFLTDRESRIVDVSPSCERMVGYARQELLSLKASDLFSDIIYESLFRNISKTGEAVSNLETVLKHRDGQDIEALITLSLRSDEEGRPLGLQGSIHDNTDKKKAEREKMRALELERIALPDPLTKAYNRRFFSEYARNEWERARRSGSAFSLVMLDIDFFKKVNDQYGHLIGDEVLVNMTRICMEHIRSTDLFARYGGEEFVILFPDLDGAGTVKRLEVLRETISRAVVARKDDEDIRITISMGVSSWEPIQDSGLSELLNQADRALYQAKETGRNRIVLFEDRIRLEMSSSV
jgi:diguanylate cyclase (GGDEF)-like protein/PAS domain S-box-containing protein